MNYASDGPTDPKDDTHDKEDITDAMETILRRRECIHDFEEIGGDLAQCRHCGERTRFRNYRGTARIMIRLTLLPLPHQLMYVPRQMLDQTILDHYDRYVDPKELNK